MTLRTPTFLLLMAFYWLGLAWFMFDVVGNFLVLAWIFGGLSIGSFVWCIAVLIYILRRG